MIITQVFLLVFAQLTVTGVAQSRYGSFTVRGTSGVPAMHAAMLPDGKVIFLDKIENFTQLHLPNGRFAYSSLYDPVTLKLTPLTVTTNPFCCGGAFLADGRLLTVGGNGPLKFLDPSVDDGFDAIRILDYPTVQVLKDGKLFVAAGSLNGLDIRNPLNNNPTYEILDKNGHPLGQSLPMDILTENQPYWMYPLLHLLPDGTLFVFAAKAAQVFQPSKDLIVRSLPDLPGMYRTYPNTGGSVILPLSASEHYRARIMICGGGASDDSSSPTDSTCGIIDPLANNPRWQITTMPGGGRSMTEGINLLDGTILWLNGARQGCQGFGTAAQPALEALIYDPKLEEWYSGGSSTIPRMYHSVALMLLDGTILIAGSNPNEMPLLLGQTDIHDPEKAFPTEFRVETYTPSYLQGKRSADRPKIIWTQRSKLKCDGSTFSIRYRVSKPSMMVDIVLYYGGFVTHALHMGQSMVYLETNGWKDIGNLVKESLVRMPRIVLAPGPYVLYVVSDGIPSIGVSVVVTD